jgi:hypothetical protein
MSKWISHNIDFDIKVEIFCQKISEKSNNNKMEKYGIFSSNKKQRIIKLGLYKFL